MEHSVWWRLKSCRHHILYTFESTLVERSGVEFVLDTKRRISERLWRPRIKQTNPYQVFTSPQWKSLFRSRFFPVPDHLPTGSKDGQKVRLFRVLVRLVVRVVLTRGWQMSLRELWCWNPTESEKSKDVRWRTLIEGLFDGRGSRNRVWNESTFGLHSIILWQFNSSYRFLDLLHSVLSESFACTLV